MANELIIDVSSHNIISPSQWDALATVVKGAVIRMSYGVTQDSMASRHVAQCKRVGLPYTGYHWTDPTWDGVNYQRQIDAIRTAITLHQPMGYFYDYEQYWTDWDAYMRQDLAECERTKFTPYQLHLFYSKIYKDTYKTMPVPIRCYSADWFINDYCPQLKTWLNTTPDYWEAKYLRYTDPTWLADFVSSQGGVVEIAEMQRAADFASTYDNPNGATMRQFESSVATKKGSLLLPKKLDFNVMLEEGAFSRVFKGEDMKLLAVPYFSQIGDQANQRVNDCGPACCSMALAGIDDTVVYPDDWYAMDGWGAPNTDIGTTASQLARALALFNITSELGASLNIDSIKSHVNDDRLIIPLVQYRVLSDAGLVQFPGTFLHWVVIVGYDEGNVIIHDPYQLDYRGANIRVPNSVFVNAYRNSYLSPFQKVKGDEIIMAYNATVNAPGGLNVRSNYPVNGVLAPKIGALPDKTRVFIAQEHPVNGTIWGNVTVPITGWVSMDYIVYDAEPTPPPSGLDEDAIRLDEDDKIIALIQKRKTELGG